jgi:hypothetical protein
VLHSTSLYHLTIWYLQKTKTKDETRNKKPKEDE